MNQQPFTLQPKSTAGQVIDGLVNVMSGLGTASDKGAYSTFIKHQRSYEEFSQMYTGTAIARKIVDIIPGDMVREWRTFEDTDLKDEQIKQYTAAERVFQVRKKVKEALMWARLYGGSLLVPIIANGDTDLSLPLELDTIRPGELRGFQVVDAKYAAASQIIDQDPTSTNYLKPTAYRLTTRAGSALHHTRVIRFDGLPLPRDEFQNNRWWSQSVLDSVYKEMTNATLVSDSLAALMHELNLDIVNIKGLSNSLAAGQEEKIKQRFEVYAFIKSMFHMALLDEDETFSNRVMPAAGVSDLIEKFYGLLAAVTDIPATRFLGNSPGGLNATGESDLRNYYDNIHDKQESDLSPPMFKLDEIISRSLWGEVPEGIHQYEWVKLWQESQKEQADRELVDAQRDAIYLQNAVVTEAQVAEELQQNKVYSNIEDSHIKDLEAFANEPPIDEETFNAATKSTSPEGKSPAEQKDEEEEL